MMPAVVAAMTLGELLGPVAGPHSAIRVTDLVSDSGQVASGAAFVALAGERTHGLAFADEALAAGASAILYEPSSRADRVVPEPAIEVEGLRARLGELGRRFYGRPHLPDGLVGVTGTNGKTTVAWLIAQALTAVDEPCGYLGTIGYGTPGELWPQSLTTPDCLTLHRELAEIRCARGCARVAVEVSSHAIAQDRIAGLGFDVAVFTNLSHDHLDWHGSMAEYFDAKARLFERDGLGAAVINVGDPQGQALPARLRPGTKALTVALDSDAGADLAASFASRGLAGLELTIRGDYGEASIESRLVGDFNAENLVLAAGALLALGHDLGDAARALGAAVPPPGRMETFGGPPARPWVIVDYAHTPAALVRVLAAISTIASGGRVTCVFGCGGERDRDKRAPMGAAAARFADRIVLTDDNPRGEDPATIVADIRAGIPAGTDVRVEHARDEAIANAVASSAGGDIVLVAGKGHETRQVIDGRARDFDDRAVVRRILEDMI